MPQSNAPQLADSYAFANPAFCAVVTCWVTRAYESITGHGSDAQFLRLHPAWAMASLALLAPSDVRALMPATSARRLSILFQDHPEWKAALPQALDTWREPFWEGVRLARATGVLEIEAGRLRATGNLFAPSDSGAIGLRKKAQAFGQILAKEQSDAQIGLAMGLAVSQ